MNKLKKISDKAFTKKLFNISDINEKLSFIVYSEIINGLFIVEHRTGDKLHREDGPAIIFSNGRKEYWINDKLHRIGGPSISYKNQFFYHINGKQIVKEQHDLLYDLYKLKGLL